MIGSSDTSGGVVVGALVCEMECSGFKSRSLYALTFFSFHLSKFLTVGCLYITRW